jgi:alpha-glucuronidase
MREMDVTKCWLQGRRLDRSSVPEALWRCGGRVAVEGSAPVLQTAADELLAGLGDLLGITGVRVPAGTQDPQILIAEPGSPAGEAVLSTVGRQKPTGETVMVKKEEDGFERIVITSDRVEGCLHGVFSLLRHLQVVGGNSCPEIVERTANSLRMAAHWDNIDGSVERGYSGHSIFFREGSVTGDLKRVRRYARLLASVGINGVVVNNVNVTGEAARLTMDTGLEGLQRLADIFRDYGISLFLSASFASPVLVGGRQGADPSDPEVARWWREVAKRLYAWVPDLGGLVVKVDSEGQPGPGSYGRDQADGANVIARALAPHGGIVLWRAFVYDCGQDWRDRKTDRARAAFDTFAPLDGKFESNVVLQIKLGPIDFQVREPPSPLLTALEETRIAVEVQVTQEYTGQQIDLCFLPPQWTEVMATQFRRGTEAVTLTDLVSGYAAGRSSGGVVGVANVGAGASWTGHPLAQANLYGLGRFAWDPLLPPAVIAEEWATQTFGPREPVVQPVVDLLLSSWRVYEAYSAPLGVGFMVNPGHHYGPNIDGYEYSRWGTYHHADHAGVGRDRTRRTGTGFTGQYPEPLRDLYEETESCPEDLLLFFHHIPYTYMLSSGTTLIQHIYDSHFEGAAAAERMREQWAALEGKVPHAVYQEVLARFDAQVANAQEWRDVVNAYFWRKSGIGDRDGRQVW